MASGRGSRDDFICPVRHGRSTASIETARSVLVQIAWSRTIRDAMAPSRRRIEMCTFAKKLALVSCLSLFTAAAAMAQQPPPQQPPPQQQVSREWPICNNSAGDNDARIAACTEVLNKGGREPSKQRA